jgi:prepilin-type N-terminal cleavage/methylation domain-containing protein
MIERDPIQSPCRLRAFTLVELLVALFIISVLMAVALPLFLQSASNAETRTCRANMQAIGNAVHSARVANRQQDYSAYIGKPITTVQEPDLTSIPICPAGGDYNILVGGPGGGPFRVQCSINAHGEFNYGVDSQ